MRPLNFGLEKQLDRIVETLALSALLANDSMRNESLKRLREIAFPLEIEIEISKDSDLTALFESEVDDDL